MRKLCTTFILLITLIFFPVVSLSHTFGEILCKTNGFFCLRVTYRDSWKSLWPNNRERRIIVRLNRMNVPIYSGQTIAVPNNIRPDETIMDFTPFPKQISPPGGKLLIFDPRLHAFGAYDSSGTLVRWGPASGGSDWCSDLDEPCHTAKGVFHIYSWGDEDCKSRKFPLPRGGAPMPYCMYFNEGQAFHGEPNGLPGYNASHGCVRLYVSDAEWLRYSFVELPNAGNRFQGTRVIVNPYAESEYEEDRHYNLDQWD